MRKQQKEVEKVDATVTKDAFMTGLNDEMASDPVCRPCLGTEGEKVL